MTWMSPEMLGVLWMVSIISFNVGVVALVLESRKRRGSEHASREQLRFQLNNRADATVSVVGCMHRVATNVERLDVTLGMLVERAKAEPAPSIRTRPSSPSLTPVGTTTLRLPALKPMVPPPFSDTDDTRVYGREQIGVGVALMSEGAKSERPTLRGGAK